VAGYGSEFDKLYTSLHTGYAERGKYGAFMDPWMLQQFLEYANNLARAEYKVPGSMFRISKQGKLYLTPQFMAMIGYRMQRSFTEMIQRAGVKAGMKAITVAGALAAGLAGASKKDRNTLLETNERIAAAMRDALWNNYGKSVGRTQQVPSYRIGHGRYAGGALKRALGASDMVVATADGIKYINQDRLNTEARQWARLNFGVAPASTPPGFQGNLTLGGKTIGTVGFRAQPRPPMFLPVGFWQWIGGKISSGPLKPGIHYERRYNRKVPATGRNQFGEPIMLGGMASFPSKEMYTVLSKRGGQPEHNYKRGWGDNHGPFREGGIRMSQQGFFPLSGSPKYPTAGVVGLNYLDYGLRTMVSMFDWEYQKVLLKWIDLARTESKGESDAGQAVFQYFLDLPKDAPLKMKFAEKELTFGAREYQGKLYTVFWNPAKMFRNTGPYA